MGYCYQGRKLCCDVCGTAGARKHKCPVDYCQPVALCKDKTCHDKWKANDHSNCRERIAKKERDQSAMLAGGLTIVLHEAESSRGGIMWRAYAWDHYSTCCDIFSKTWLDQPDIDLLRYMGNTIEFEPAKEVAP